MLYMFALSLSLAPQDVPGLMASILQCTYQNIGQLLRSSNIITSTRERSLLKNLGSWLGQITLARNKPVLQQKLDLKELLFQVTNSHDLRLL